MDIKEALTNFVTNSNQRNPYVSIEKLITIMLRDYLYKQGKTIVLGERPTEIFDFLMPNGIDENTEPVAVEIKMFRTPFVNPRVIYDVIGRFSLYREDINTLLLIIVNEIPDRLRKTLENRKESTGFQLIIWDINDLVRIFSLNEKLFEETFNSINTLLIQDTINNGIRRKSRTYIEKRERYLEQLKQCYEKDDLVLFLGAGISSDAGISTWDNLITGLFIALIDKQLVSNKIVISDKEKEQIVKKIIEQNGNSPLLQTRFLRNGFEEDFEEEVRKLLYQNASDKSKILEEIGQLCVPKRGKVGVQAVVNYNFDDLIEKNLKRLRVKYKSIYTEGVIPDTDELGIYHVHGFLPRMKKEYSNLTKSHLIFSEEEYHKLMIEPYNWANFCQLDFMINNTCLFIGLSMTDPNMRRLLEIAVNMRPENDMRCRHYAIMRRFQMEQLQTSAPVRSFESVNEELQESFFNELGINVIWVDDYDEIPDILKRIKINFDSVE